jgi:hypothetical protein
VTSRIAAQFLLDRSEDGTCYCYWSGCVSNIIHRPMSFNNILGVVGLSTAIRIQELGHKVTILAEHLPGDKKTIEYTSPWAVSCFSARLDKNEMLSIFRVLIMLVWLGTIKGSRVSFLSDAYSFRTYLFRNGPRDFQSNVENVRGE